MTAPAASTGTAAHSPGVHGGHGAQSAGRRRCGHNASRASSGNSASPPARPTRYSELGAKLSVMVPDVPAGSTQACCQPLTANGRNRSPVLVRATQPGLMLSGTTSTRDVVPFGTLISRRAGPQAPVVTGVAVAVVTWPDVSGSSSMARHSADSASILADSS